MGTTEDLVFAPDSCLTAWCLLSVHSGLPAAFACERLHYYYQIVVEISFARKESWKQSLVSCLRFFSLRKSRNKGGGLRLEIRWQRGLFFMLFAAMVCYALAAVGLYAWRSTVPFNQVRFTDIALPWNWGDMKARLSATNLKRAENNLKEENYREAYIEVRAAVNHYPSNFEARLLMARLLAGSNGESAVQILRRGYQYGLPKDATYDSLFLALAIRLEDYEALADVLPRLIHKLQSEPASEQTQRRIDSYQVVLLQAQMKLNDFVAALQTVDNMEATKSQVQTLPLRLHLLIRMGSFAKFDSIIAQLPRQERESATIVMLRAQAAYERGDIEAAQTYVGRALANNTNNWNTYVDGIKLLLRMDQVRKAEEYVDLYLYYNGSNVPAIQQLAAALTDWPSSYLVNKIKLWSLASNAQLYPVMLFYEVQALFREGKFTEARGIFDNWVQYVPEQHKDYRYVTAYGALFNAVLSNNENTRQQLLEIFEGQAKQNAPFPEEIYLIAADALRKVGRYNLSEAVLAQGSAVYPNSTGMVRLRRTLREERSGIAGASRSGTSRSGSTGWESDADNAMPADVLRQNGNGSESGAIIFNLEDIGNQPQDAEL